MSNSMTDMFYDEDSAQNNDNSQSMVVEWLNEASLADNSIKLELLRKVQEYILHKDVQLAKVYLENVLGFCTDSSQEIRKFIVAFIEEACKIDESLFPMVSQHFTMLVNDKSIQVQKRAVQAARPIYRCALHHLSNAPQVTDEMEKAWNQLCEIKTQIIAMIDNDNDGIRTNAIKCLEGIVLLQTYKDKDSADNNQSKPAGQPDLSLDDVPLTLKVARRRKLEEEAIQIFQALIQFHGSQHISSVNLMACMGAICTIAKSRSQFMPRVLDALDSLNSNLPPTLSNSQVSTVRKQLKLQLFNMLKHPASLDYHQNITQLLTELGASHQDIVKNTPKIDKAEERRRQKRFLEAELNRHLMKKPRLEQDEEKTKADLEVDELDRKRQQINMVNERFVFEKLQNIDSVVQLVMVTMLKLPNKISAEFIHKYSPIPNSGSISHIKNLSKLIGEKLTDLSMGPSANIVKDALVTRAQEELIISKPSLRTDENNIKMEEDIADSESLKLEAMKKLRENMEKERKSEMNTKALKLRVKSLKLQEITKPMVRDVKEGLLLLAVKRILQNERESIQGGVMMERCKIITTLATSFKPDVRQAVLEYILLDVRNRIDLAFSWLYEEYSLLQGFARRAFQNNVETKPDFNYEWVLCSLIKYILGNMELRDKESLLTRIYLEVPYITDEAASILASMCEDEHVYPISMKLLKQLVLKRPPKQMKFLNILLCFTVHETEYIRDCAIKTTVEVYQHSEMIANQVEDRATTFMNYLTLAEPPEQLFGPSLGRPIKSDVWVEDLYKQCLYLYLGLLPISPVLIHELARVYVQTEAEVKRYILRLLETPIRLLGMDCSELMRLVEACAKGAETLVTRVIHILTEKNLPSMELVSKVRDLYQTKVSDVRFLIPVLNGLTKKEVLSALPKLIKLNAVVVKEVFNKLLNTQTDLRMYPSPVTPIELLVALHTIDAASAELKFVVKATSLCLAEKDIYTQEVLAIVIQQLIELTPLPTLLMRTVLQSMSMYPSLSSYVMSILQRLIIKQVWQQKLVWDGFLKCCQRTKPQCLPVLLHLPLPQLSEALVQCPDLHEPLKEHINSLDESEKAVISQELLDMVLELDTKPIIMPTTVNVKIEPPMLPVISNDLAPPGLE